MTLNDDVARLRQLHARMLANAGGDFEADCDDDFRLACKELLPALLEEREAMRRLMRKAEPPRVPCGPGSVEGCPDWKRERAALLGEEKKT